MPSWSELDDPVRFPIWFGAVASWFLRPAGRADLFGEARLVSCSFRPLPGAASLLETGHNDPVGTGRFHSKGLVINLWRIHRLSAEKNARRPNAPRARSVRRQNPSSRVTILADRRSRRSRRWLAAKRNGRRNSIREPRPSKIAKGGAPASSS